MRSIHYIKGAVFSVVSIFAISCTKSELPENLSTAQISFTNSVIENHITKSDASVSIPEFYVFAYHTGEQLFQDYITSGILPVANWMYGQKVERTSENTYTYSPVTYWPINPNEKITFIGYYAQNEENVKVVSPDPITKKGEPIMEYTTDPQNPQFDLLTSQPAYDLTRANGNVKLHMQHAQSRLQFAVKSTTVNTKIISIGLKNVYTKAQFSAHGRVWSKHSDRKELATQYLKPIEQDLHGKLRLLSQYYIVIPQKNVTESEKPIFTIVFEDNGEKKIFEYSPTSNWEKYNSYTYNITYAAGNLAVELATEPWTENNVGENIEANQYLRVSTRNLDLAQSHHFYYNSSFPTSEIGQEALYPDNTAFNLYDFFKVFYEGQKIRLKAISDAGFEAERFTIFLHGLDLHGHTVVKVPINVKTESEDGIEIDGTFWAPGNIIYHDGHLDIAPNSNYTGLYFRWGSLIGLAGNNAKSFQFIPEKTIGFRPSEFNHAINKWDDVPYERTMDGGEYNDAFAGRYDNQLGFDGARALGDPCRYMSNQKGWTKGKWRMPTKTEYDAIINNHKIRRINGTWGIADESHEHSSATTGLLPVDAGWFVKTDVSDNNMPSDEEFNPSHPPKGWVFFPAAGQRAGWTGSLSEYSSMGYYWTSTTTSWDASYRYQFSNINTGDNLGSFSSIASGYVEAQVIRCVKDIDK